MSTPEPIRNRLKSRDPRTRDMARQEVARVLADCGGSISAAARRLGLSPATVRRWGRLFPPTVLPRHQAPPLSVSQEEYGSSFPVLDATPGPAATKPPESGKRQEGPGAAPSPTPPGPEAAHHPAIRSWEEAVPDPWNPQPEPRELAFVLHSHLPWVLGHGTWPHGEEWLAEAVVHCYLPLIAVFQKLRDEGLRNVLTFSITPVLAAQLADPRTRELVDRYLEQRITAAHAAITDQPLATWWTASFDSLRSGWQRIGKDIIGTLGSLAAEGVIELGTCAATHAYLPLTHTEEMIRLQLRTAVDLHERLFGMPPRGAWLPECAYRPGGPWRHPVTGARETFRPGLEHYLQEHGISWTIVDTHLVLGGEPRVASSGDNPRNVAVVEGSVAEPVWIGASSVAAFVREPRSALQVWSRDHGYPGDARYLDFHKRHWPSGLRLWRVTHPRADLADKLPYDPRAAADAVATHADHFVRMVSHLAGLDHGVAVCPFDTELFGHWWYEGPQWLERVLRLAAAHPLLTPTGVGRRLRRRPPEVRVALPEGSWGEGGDHRVWVNPDTDWMWHQLGSSEFAVQEACRRPATIAIKRAILNQLMILSASDWPFLVTTGAARDYAEKRFTEHRDRLQQLLAASIRMRHLPAWAEADLAFPDLNPHWWSSD